MSSIVTDVIKTTAVWVAKKLKNKAAEKLKDGDVTEQIFREMIVSEIDDIRSKLDGLSRNNLLASISFFKQGIELLYEVFDNARSKRKYDAVTTQGCAEAISLTEGMKTLKLTDLDESAVKALTNAKKRFEEAREKATVAFNNEALETSDRILAMQFQVMATVLEDVDNPAVAVPPCRVCIRELNSLKTVQSCFGAQLNEGHGTVRDLVKSVGKVKRKKIISSVCQVNWYVYDVTRAVGRYMPFWIWPCVETGEDKVDPLRDLKVAKVLFELGMEHCCVTPWSFGQEGAEEHKLKEPRGIATNSSGQFIVGDSWHDNVKVFDSAGTFTSLLSLPTDCELTRLVVLDVATDMNDNIYVLVAVTEIGASRDHYVVYQFKSTRLTCIKFAVRARHGSRLTVTDSGKVLVLWSKHVVDVYVNDGQFVQSFGEEIFYQACDISAANDNRVMIMYRDWAGYCVDIFSEHGDHLNKFKLQLQGSYLEHRIAFHRASEHVVVAGERGKDLLDVEVYTKDGEFVRSTQIHDKRIGYFTKGMTVTTHGRIAVTCEKEVLVI